MGRVWWIAPAFILLGGGCKRSAAPDHDERQRDQDRQRTQRLDRIWKRRLADARKRRRAYAERSRIRRETMWTRGPGATCDPATEVRKLVGSGAIKQRFEQGVALLLEAGPVDTVDVGGRLLQRFRFRVRMHPADEPRLGRPKLARATLAISLMATEACQRSRTVIQMSTLELEVARTIRPHASVTLRPHHPTLGKRRPKVPVGADLELLLDTKRVDLSTPRTVDGQRRMLWQIAQARFLERPRHKRLSVPSEHLGDALRQLWVVEVPCPDGAPNPCRFATRQRGAVEEVMPVAKVLRLAAPIEREARARQLHQLLIALRYPRCVGRPRKHSYHACLRAPDDRRLLCQLWQAQAGFASKLVVDRVRDSWRFSHVLACPGKKVRFLQLTAHYSTRGDLRVETVDLQPRLGELRQQLRQRYPQQP